MLNPGRSSLMAETNETLDIRVAVVSDDPFFLFATRALLGRDRSTRIMWTGAALGKLKTAAGKMAGRIEVIVCDLDSVAHSEAFYNKLRALIDEMEAQVICLAAGNLPHVVAQVADIPLAGLLVKGDLRYCLHLAVRAVSQHEVVLVTERVRPLLEPGMHLHERGRTLGPHRAHPDLSNRKEQVATLRAFVGLDNPDISDELTLSDNAIREYISDVYALLGAAGELDVFDAMSEWWWTTRFLQALV
jgi:DNA-binding NarL/FixJ family response regulator